MTTWGIGEGWGEEERERHEEKREVIRETEIEIAVERKWKKRVTGGRENMHARKHVSWILLCINVSSCIGVSPPCKVVIYSQQQEGEYMKYSKPDSSQKLVFLEVVATTNYILLTLKTEIC